MTLPFKLIIVTDEAPALLTRVEAALTVQGSDKVALLLRDKQAPSGALLAVAQELRAVTRARGSRLLISDRVDIALLCDADGVQLPEVGVGIADARRLLGRDRLVGVSRHSLTGILQAERAGADYATLSPVFATPHKGSPMGTAALAEIAAQTSLPVYALGGVTVDRVPALTQAGAAGAAVIREVMSAAAPGSVVSELLRALEPRTHPN